jgi:hypothetical protein
MEPASEKEQPKVEANITATEESKTTPSHVTHHQEEESKHEPSAVHKPMGVPQSKEEYELKEGYQDELGFYILPDGDFYDPWGYYFDAEGYD